MLYLYVLQAELFCHYWFLYWFPCFIIWDSSCLMLDNNELWFISKTVSGYKVIIGGRMNYRIIKVLMLVAFSTLLMSCQQPIDKVSASIRFQNLTYISGEEFTIGYGIKYGNAVHEGPVGFAATTPYYPITQGNYSIMMKTSSGSWLTVSAGSMPSPSSSGKYTIVITGDWDYGTIMFQGIQDE